MAKKNEPKQEAPKQEDNLVPVTMLAPETIEALSMVQRDGLYSVVKLTLVNGVVTKTELMHDPDVKAIAADVFKITAAKTFLVNQ